VKKTAVFLFAGLVLAVTAFAGTWTGTISDAKCGKAHADASEKSMNCVKGCIKGGQAPVFVVGDNVYKFDEASKSKIEAHLGQKVTIDGELKDGVISVASVKAAH
jgi:hypothetical protein